MNAVTVPVIIAASDAVARSVEKPADLDEVVVEDSVRHQAQAWEVRRCGSGEAEIAFGSADLPFATRSPSDHLLERSSVLDVASLHVRRAVASAHTVFEAGVACLPCKTRSEQTHIRVCDRRPRQKGFAQRLWLRISWESKNVPIQWQTTSARAMVFLPRRRLQARTMGGSTRTLHRSRTHGDSSTINRIDQTPPGPVSDQHATESLASSQQRSRTSRPGGRSLTARNDATPCLRAGTAPSPPQCHPEFPKRSGRIGMFGSLFSP